MEVFQEGLRLDCGDFPLGCSTGFAGFPKGLGKVWAKRVWGSILDVFQEGVSSIWEVVQKGDPNVDGCRDLLKSLNGGAPRRGTQLDG